MTASLNAGKALLTRLAGYAEVAVVQILPNPYKGTGLSNPDLEPAPFPLADACPAVELVSRCPHAAETPLVDASGLASAANIKNLLVKDERARMGLGSFKALGAAHVIARDHVEGKARGRTYVTASAGNHGMSVAAGAQAFGAKAVIYIAETVPQSFADRLTAQGARVMREGPTYEDSMAAAQKFADDHGHDLLSDSSWPGYFERPHILMEGYLILMEEIVRQMDEPPTHIFVQAGVGGLAGAVAAHARLAWGKAPTIIVVEPEVAPALINSIKAGAPVATPGPVSSMGRLDCKEPSLIALKGLARDADFFATISEDEALAGTETAASHDLSSTPSGAASIAAVFASEPHREALGLTSQARVLTFLSEMPDA